MEKKVDTKPTTKEEVIELFEKMIRDIDEEILNSKSASTKTKTNSAFLRKQKRELKTLMTVSKKLLKNKTKRQPNSNKNSGFCKPVKVSDEMAQFMNLEDEKICSRVDVTRFICNYIRDKKLQDPSNGRVIHPDEHLTKILGYKQYELDENGKEIKLDKDGNEIKPAQVTYYNMQKYLKDKEHFKNLSEEELNNYIKTSELPETPETPNKEPKKAVKKASKVTADKPKKAVKKASKVTSDTPKKAPKKAVKKT